MPTATRYENSQSQKKVASHAYVRCLVKECVTGLKYFEMKFSNIINNHFIGVFLMSGTIFLDGKNRQEKESV